MTTNWKAEWMKEPCNKCPNRWPNKNNPQMEVGDGCDGLACYHRPDLYDMSEQKAE